MKEIFYQRLNCFLHSVSYLEMYTKKSPTKCLKVSRELWQKKKKIKSYTNKQIFLSTRIYARNKVTKDAYIDIRNEKVNIRFHNISYSLMIILVVLVLLFSYAMLFCTSRPHYIFGMCLSSLWSENISFFFLFVVFSSLVVSSHHYLGLL